MNQQPTANSQQPTPAPAPAPATSIAPAPVSQGTITKGKPLILVFNHNAEQLKAAVNRCEQAGYQAIGVYVFPSTWPGVIDKDCRLLNPHGTNITYGVSSAQQAEKIVAQFSPAVILTEQADPSGQEGKTMNQVTEALKANSHGIPCLVRHVRDGLHYLNDKHISISAYLQTIKQAFAATQGHSQGG